MRDQRGTTLAEVMIALGMLAFAMLYSMSATDQIVATAHISKDMSKAHNIASEVMEELLAVYDSDTKLTNGTHTQDFDRDGRRITSGTAYFIASWDVRIDSPITKVTDIQLVVRWTERGRERTIQLRTFRST